MEPSTISGTNLRTAFVLLLVVAVTALFLAVTWPFFKPLLLGALLAGLFHPLYRWITRLLGGRRFRGRRRRRSRVSRRGAGCKLPAASARSRRHRTGGGGHMALA